jgi:hypothetical protein
MEFVAVRLSEVEVDHLLTLLRDAELEGSYYGNREHYWKRHARIWRKLQVASPPAADAVARSDGDRQDGPRAHESSSSPTDPPQG